MSSYIIGILLSFLLVKFNKKKLISNIQALIYKKIKNSYIYELVTLLYIVIIASGIYFIGHYFNTILHSTSIPFVNTIDMYNLITIFFLLDFSKTESIALNCTNRDNYNSAVKSIAKSITLGFVAPLFYLSVFGNFYSLIICSVFCLKKENTLFIRSIYRLFSIIPSLITILLIYIIMLFSKKREPVNYKNMFATNLFLDPLINVYITTACLMDTFMLIDYQNLYDNRVIKYGSNRNIEKFSLHRLLSKAYIICSISFILFAVINF